MPFRNKNQDRHESDQNAMSDEEFRDAIEAHKSDQTTELRRAIEEANVRGKTLGKLEGRLEGRAEARQEAARTLRDQGITEEIILRATGLSFTDLQRLEDDAKHIENLRKATNNAMSDEEIRYAIEARQKYQRDRVTELNVAVEEAKAQGRAWGRAQAEAEATRETAKAMRDLGMSEDIILKTTGVRFAHL